MKFIIIKKQPLKRESVAFETRAFFDRESGEILETVDTEELKEIIKCPPAIIEIKVAGKYLTTPLIKAITPAYLRGTQIFINGIEFETCNSNPQYFYMWQDKVPAALPQHLKDAYYNCKLRGKLYDELVAWNQSRIELAQKRSEFRWQFAEDFYKELFKKLKAIGIKVLSPNRKTFFEARAELNLDAWLQPQKPLSREEEDFLIDAKLKRLDRAFGLQDVTLSVGVHHRTTKHGTTFEPYINNSYDINMAITAQSFNRKDGGREVEGYVDAEGFEVKQWNSASANIVVSHQRERDNIDALKFYLSLDKKTQELFLMPGWHFCPVCGRVYNEADGCYASDGTCHVEEIEFVSYNENHSDEDDDYFDYDNDNND